MSDFFIKLLDSRERRFQYQQTLINKYKRPIISYMLNIPGKVKRTDEYVVFHKMGIELIKSILGNKILVDEYYDEDTGMYYLAAVNQDAIELKKQMMELEDSVEGRLFDIDVFDENAKQITRSSLNLEPRKCLLCSEMAKACARNQTHPYEELIEETNKIINDFINKNLQRI